ncbi:MAG TPA: MmcQ/YjbR family DNA-binding protein [Flavobacteriales bacterium]|nr:MmcQ/YjbR family DNA-binding protein [Flavobacteriales bacterium]HIN39991.1 MmcQ/YjbR family DNA-binding protein [Flavobacteriales bacterium]
MNIEEYRDFCLSFYGVTEGFPFDEHVLVFKVKGKIFSLTDIKLFNSINLKCNPEKAIELRELYSAVLPGYHMNKKHWNTVLMDDSLQDTKIRAMIRHSYDLVVKKLPKNTQRELLLKETSQKLNNTK